MIIIIVKANIDLYKPVLQEDFNFVNNIIHTNEFHSYINETADGIFNDCYIITNRIERLGIYYPQISKALGIKTARPIIYLSKRKSIYTLKCISSIMCHLFEVEKIDRLEAKVYSNNNNMLSIIHRSILKYEGCFRYGYSNNKIPINIYFYSLLNHEYFEISEKLKTDTNHIVWGD